MTDTATPSGRGRKSSRGNPRKVGLGDAAIAMGLSQLSAHYRASPHGMARATLSSESGFVIGSKAATNLPCDGVSSHRLAAERADDDTVG